MTTQCVISLEQPPRPAWIGQSTHPPGVQRYQLTELWSLHHYDYAAQSKFGDHSVRIRRGEMTLVPPKMESCYTWSKPSTHQYAHFHLSLVSDQPCYQMPVLIPLKKIDTALRRLLQKAVNVWPMRSSEATCLLWRLLWLLVERCGQPFDVDEHIHPAVRQAESFISQHISEAIRVDDIVASSDISHNHLIRLFQETHGMTIAGYLRRRRSDKARHLLTQTNLPIKVIAMECGVWDLQAFNKMIRRELGASPSQYRLSGQCGIVISNH